MDSIGPYEILREIGSGGSAIVYLARHKELGTQKAIKVIRRELIGNETAIADFRRGAGCVPSPVEFGERYRAAG